MALKGKHLEPILGGAAGLGISYSKKAPEDKLLTEQTAGNVLMGGLAGTILGRSIAAGMRAKNIPTPEVDP